MSSTQIDEQLTITHTQIIKALHHLEVSIQKTRLLSVELDALADEQLEAFESLSSRFSRTVDLFTSKWLRAKVLKEEPGFRGSTRDLMNFAEKLELIESSEKWLELKELRNRQAHDYEDSRLSKLFNAIRAESETVLNQLRKIFN